MYINICICIYIYYCRYIDIFVEINIYIYIYTHVTVCTKEEVKNTSKFLKYICHQTKAIHRSEDNHKTYFIHK